MAQDAAHPEGAALGLAVARHFLFVRARDVREGLSLDPNARIPNINKRVYGQVESSLLGLEGTPGTFHLKHKGVTIVAESVQKKGNATYILTLGEGHGILDGGHTYELILKDRDEVIPDDQYVKFEILTKVPSDWIVEIAGGLNTSVQVQPMSLYNLADRFEWIKDELRPEPYFDSLAWKENQGGEFDARDLVSLMTLFNIELFPNTNDEQPVVGYERKSKALDLYEANEDSYRRVRPILKDILRLHDTIRRDAQKYWNESGGNFGNFAFVEVKKRGTYQFPFTGEEGKARVMNGALYPMLAAFRWMVQEGKDGGFEWRGGYHALLKRWESSAEELIRMTAQANTELGRNPNAIGKSRNHWANLHARVAMRDLLERQAS